MPSAAIAIAGEIASGKSTIATRIGAALDLPVVSFGSFVRAHAAGRNLDARDRAVLQDLGAELLAEMGPADFLDAVLDYNASTGDAVIVEGVRHSAIASALRARYRTFLIYIDTPVVERAVRWSERDQLDVAAFDRASQHAVEREIADLRSMADLVVGTEPGDVERALAAVGLFLAG